MATAVISTSTVGNSLTELMSAQDIQPGDTPSYQLCKTLYVYHPLGQKMTESPVRMAQSQPREITIATGPEERCKEAFLRQWNADNAEKYILQTATLSRVYGIASVACLIKGEGPEKPLDFTKLADAEISFNVLDPLNTAGSLVLDLDPNKMDYLKTSGIRVNGVAYHRSRSCILMHGQPIYLEYTNSSFGYVGRSVYQPVLFPLKSFINSMITDDMVVYKSGLLVAMMKGIGSIIDNIISRIAGMKRALLQQGGTNNIISIDTEESIETLNMQNLEGPFTAVRKNILENIAAGDDMPAQMLNSETFAEGFGEGTEDAKKIASYVKRLRNDLAPLYAYFDKIIQHRAWNRDFFKTVQNDFPDQYGSVSYEAFLMDCINSFSAKWPNLIEEPESELVKVDDVKLKGTIAIAEVLLPILDPDNKATLVEWICDSFNDRKLLFNSPLILDIDALRNYEPPQPMAQDGEPKPGKPFAANDSDNLRVRRALDDLSSSVARLPERYQPRRRTNAKH